MLSARMLRPTSAFLGRAAAAWSVKHTRSPNKKASLRLSYNYYAASSSVFPRTQQHAAESTTRLFSSASLNIPPPPTSNHVHHTLVPNASGGSIIYTETDEAPALATYNLLPVIAKVRNTKRGAMKVVESML